MRIHRRPSGLLLLVVVILAAAAPLSMVPARSGADTMVSRIGPSVALAQAGAAERPAWHSLSLTDARTGQAFTLADFAGKTVYVESMATWCTSCRQQMGIIRDDLMSQVDPERAVLLGLSVETDLQPVTLADYVNAQGFSWKFAVMTPEMLQALATTFGLTITNPTAIPHFVIGPDGAMSDLMTGLHTADSLRDELASAGRIAQ